MRLRLVIGISCVVAVLAACAPNVSPDSYSVGSVGQVNISVPGVIISVRQVNISGTTRLGSAAGGTAGAVAGSALGGNDTRGNIIGAVGGAVAGALVGAAIEANASKQTGMEYVVQTQNGNLLTIVQGPTPALTVNEKVIVLYGSPSRVIADPRN